MLKTRAKLYAPSAVSLFTRIIVGLVFVQSGWGKLQHLPNVVEYFGSLGIPMPGLQAPVIAGLEVVCGTLLILGLLTRIASFFVICIMLAAIFFAKKADLTGVSDLFALSEFLYLVLACWLMALGAGHVSLDQVVRRIWCSKTVRANLHHQTTSN